MKTQTQVEVPSDLIEAIRTFPLERDVEHCGDRIPVSPFEFYAKCPRCGRELKLRSFSAIPEIEDVFDAVFEWMERPGARELARRRQELLRADTDE
jgi:hypothetical protein